MPTRMRRWFKREKPELVDIAIVLGVIVLLTVVGMALFGGVGAGAGAGGLGVAMAARSSEREAARRAAGEPRGRLTVRGMRQAGAAVWAALLVALLLVVAIQRRHEDPLAFVGVLACSTALAGWTAMRLLDRRR